MINLLSLIVEIIVTLLGFSLALQKKKSIGWLIALTFGIYVLYDASRFLKLEISSELLSLLFLAASLSALTFTWQLLKKA